MINARKPPVTGHEVWRLLEDVANKVRAAQRSPVYIAELFYILNVREQAEFFAEVSKISRKWGTDSDAMQWQVVGRKLSADDVKWARQIVSSFDDEQTVGK